MCFLLFQINNMAHQINPHQQKLAEKLTILNDRGIGMLTRIFNIKKVNFLTDEVQLTFENIYF